MSGTTERIYDNTPGALDKLTERIKLYEAQMEAMRECNFHFKKHGNLDGFEPAVQPPDFDVIKYRCGTRPPYSVENFNSIRSKIKQTQKRICEYRERISLSARPERIVNSVRIIEDKQKMRITLYMSKDTRAIIYPLLKKFHFKTFCGQTYRDFTKEGLQAVDAFASELQALPPINNNVPAPLPKFPDYAISPDDPDAVKKTLDCLYLLRQFARQMREFNECLLAHGYITGFRRVVDLPDYADHYKYKYPYSPTEIEDIDNKIEVAERQLFQLQQTAARKKWL